MSNNNLTNKTIGKNMKSPSWHRDETIQSKNNKAKLIKYTKMYTGAIQEHTPIEITWSIAEYSSPH